MALCHTMQIKVYQLHAECKIKVTCIDAVIFMKKFFLQAKIERENNLKEFKSAYDIDAMPKFGAGSEYGRDQREEARKKKFGVRIRKYNSDDQPWLLRLGGGPGSQPRRYFTYQHCDLLLQLVKHHLVANVLTWYYNGEQIAAK
jgi:Transcription initiation factor IIF, alpha subunit (TFIIF-alpha)